MACFLSRWSQAGTPELPSLCSSCRDSTWDSGPSNTDSPIKCSAETVIAIQQKPSHLLDSAVLAVAELLTCSGSLPPSMDIVFAVPSEDVLHRPAAASAESGSDADTGGAGATGALRRLLALMLNDALLMRFVLSPGLLAASPFACASQAATQHEGARALSRSVNKPQQVACGRQPGYNIALTAE